MNKATKAALFNALLFPGWGQFYLKCYKRGLIFLLPVLSGTLALAWMVIQVGIVIIKSAPFKKGTVQFENIVQITIDAFRSINLPIFLLILSLISFLWILSIIDAYHQGKKLTTSSLTTGENQESASDRV